MIITLVRDVMLKGKKLTVVLFIGKENEEKRTHETFVNQIHKGHHLGMTPLTEIENFDMVFGFPLDYMHMACLGTMRRLLNFWFKSDSAFRLSPTFRRQASAKMLEIAPWVQPASKINF